MWSKFKHPRLKRSGVSINWNFLGVAHSDDVSLVFDTPMFKTRSSEDFKMQNLLMDFYISFANTG